MLKKIFLLFSCILMSYAAFSQQNLSVPLTDPVYNIIEYSQLRNYLPRLNNSRPYTLNVVLTALNTILSHPNVSLKEKIIIQDTINRLKPPAPTLFDKDNSLLQNIKPLVKTGTYRYENLYPISVEVGVTWETDIAANFTDGSISNYNWLDVFLLGDIGSNFSYNINIGMGITKLDFGAYRPNSFSKSWDGYQHILSDLSTFGGASEELSGVIRLLPEFGVSFWDNKLGINLSRIRRDWGTGNGNLMLSNTARPFTAIEMYLRPVNFLSLSFITGTLEFQRDGSIKEDAKTFQNAYTAFMGEIFFGEIAYAAVTASSIWPKRFEMGYLNPGMIPFFYQNMIGDFDNLQMGLSLGLNIPGSTNFYFNLFMDELNFASEDFFYKDRNMYAYQTGVKVAIPSISFITFNLQYTKIEPYMYTHPGAEVPWYGDKIMELNYVNHGENLGYNLQPNSDELKISATSNIFWFLQANAFYSLVRHGTTYGPGKVDGSSIYDKLPYGTSGVGQMKKNFLKDGVYEWTHALGASAKLDMRFVKDIPLSLNFGYTFTYTHHTAKSTGPSFKPETNSIYKDRLGNYFSLSVKVF